MKLSPITMTTKLLRDASVGGSLMPKSAENATTIIEKISPNDHQVQHNRNPSIEIMVSWI